MEPIEVTVDYGTHKVTARWFSDTETHCPRCGVQGSVWFEEFGDYYLEERHVCAACGSTFHLPGEVRPCRDQEVQVLSQLRALKEPRPPQ